MHNAYIVLAVILIAAFVFEFINGFHDTANSIATVVSTRALSPRVAVGMAAVLNFVGAYVSTTFYHSGVEHTISAGLIKGTVPQHVIFVALITAIIWGLFTWKRGLPSSSSHALIGGLLGANIIDRFSTETVQWNGVFEKIILPLFASPIIGFFIAFLVMNLLLKLLRNASIAVVNRYFPKLQIFSAAFMSFSHGSNDAQKTMGMVTMALLSLNAAYPNELAAWMLPTAHHPVPTWVIMSCALIMALGTSFGGWRIIKTVGGKLFKMNNVEGFAAQTTAAIVIETASLIGAPVSTTQVISSSIMGVGSARRLKRVKWSVAREIVMSWIITIPATVVLGAVLNFILKLLFALVGYW